MTYKSKSTIMAGVTDIQNIVVSIGGTMAFIIGLIGVLNFANTMLTSIFTRRREFATLQSVGMTGRQLLKMLRRELRLCTFGNRCCRPAILGWGFSNYSANL